MATKYEYNGHEYWVTVDPAMNPITNEQQFIAYVSDSKPGGLLNGKAVKGGDGRTLVFESAIAALTNANAVKQSEIDANR